MSHKETIMFSFWPFRKPQTKWEILQDSTHEKLEDAKETFDDVRDGAVHAAGTVGAAFSELAHVAGDKAGSAAHTASSVLAGTLASLKARGGDARESAHDALEDAHDFASDKRVAATKFASKVAGNVASTATGSAHAAQQTAKSALETVHDSLDDVQHGVLNRLNQARKRAAETAHAAEESAQNATEAAQDTAKRAFLKAHDTKRDAKRAASEHSRNAAKAASDSSVAARQRAAELAAAALASAAALREQAADTSSRVASQVSSRASAHLPAQLPDIALPPLGEAVSHLGEKWFEGRQKAARQARDLADRYTGEAPYIELRRKQKPQVIIDDSSSKWLWIAVGVLVGAGIMFLMAPNNGRRSRAMMKERADKARRKAARLGEEAKRRAADLSNRVEGKLQERSHSGDIDDADDITVADRVRTALGENPLTRNLERINVDSVDGVVTLRGPIMDAELITQIEAAVRKVRGVRDVQTQHLLLENSPEDSATFVG